MNGNDYALVQLIDGLSFVRIDHVRDFLLFRRMVYVIYVMFRCGSVHAPYSVQKKTIVLAFQRFSIECFAMELHFRIAKGFQVIGLVACDSEGPVTSPVPLEDLRSKD